MKYYKIVNTEGHHGLVYKEGLNVDPQPFNPSGNCDPGGIYFAREDILAFVNLGTELYEVEPVAEVYQNQYHDWMSNKWKAHSVILKYIGPLEDNIQFLVQQGANIKACTHWNLSFAERKGHFKLLDNLIKNGAESISVYNYPNDNYAFIDRFIDYTSCYNQEPLTDELISTIDSISEKTTEILQSINFNTPLLTNRNTPTEDNFKTVSKA